MGATFGRIKTWVRERLKYSDLNGEFNNILNNFTPTGMDDASETVTDMRATTNPAPYVGGVQTESLATNLLGELQRMRFVMQRFFGGQYWYSDPGRVLGAPSSDLAVSLAFQGNSQEDVYRDFIARGGLINALSLSTADVLAADFDGTNKKFGNFSYDLGAGNIMAVPNPTQVYASLSMHFRSLTAGDYLAYNPLLGIELFLNGSGFLSTRVVEATAASEAAKNVTTITGAVSRAANTNFAHAMLRYQLNNVLGVNTDALDQRYNGAAEGSQVSSDNILVNSGRGGVWFVGAKRNDPAWDKVSTMSVTPDTEVTDPWTGVGDTADGAVANGVLSIDVPIGDDLLYTKSNNINLAAMTVDTKFRVRSIGPDLLTERVVLFTVADNSMGSIVRVFAYNDRIVLDNGSGGFYTVMVDTSQWHRYRLTSLGGSPVTNFYIDGVLQVSFTNLTGGVVGADLISFGVPASGTGMSVDYEDFRYFGSGASVAAPVAVSTSGELADIALMKTFVSDAVATQLVNNKATSVFGVDVNRGLALPGDFVGSGSVTGAGAVPNAVVYFASDGESPVQYAIVGSATSNQGGTVLNLVEDDVYELSSVAVGAATVAVPVDRKKVYKLGLRKLSFVYEDLSGVGTNSFNGSVSVSKG